MGRRNRIMHRWAQRSTGLIVAATVAVYAALWPVLFFGVRLPYESYFSPVLTARLFDSPLVVPLLFVHGVWVALGGHRLGWQTLDRKRRARILVAGVAMLFAFTYATLPYNFFYDQEYLVDRVLLLGAVGCIWAHPAAVQPFVVLLLVFAHQTSYPLPEAGWLWPDKRLPLDFLILFTSYLYVRTVTKPRRHVFPVLALALTGGVYGFAAIAKLRLGPELWSWVTENRLSYLTVSSYLGAGWLSVLGEERLMSLAQAAARLDHVVAVGSLTLELAGFAILLGPRITKAVLIGFLCLHTAIVMASGIFFWKWMIFDGLLLLYVLRLRRDSYCARLGAAVSCPLDRRLYSIRTGVLALLVMGGSGYYFRHVPFAWWDTRFVNQVRLEAVTSAGTRHPIDGRFFAPYDIMFVQARFFFLQRRPVLSDTFGTVYSYELARALEDAQVVDLPRLRSQHGRVLFSERSTRVFVDFVRRFVNAAEAREGRGSVLQAFAPPLHFRGNPRPEAYTPGDVRDVERIEVAWEETFFDGRQIVPVGRSVLWTISLNEPASR